MAALILVLGVVGTGAVLVFQQEQRLAEYLPVRASTRADGAERQGLPPP